MSTQLLGGITFVVVFAGIILIHELGHFIVARWMKIEVEEFGFGFPPRLLRLWRGKGSLVIKDTKVRIPRNFDLPFDPASAIRQPVKALARPVRDILVLQSIEILDEASEQIQAVPASNHPDNLISQKQENKTEPDLVTLTGPLSGVLPGTEFTLNWIPLGGFNKVKGEDDPNSPGGLASAKPWKRIAVLIAGVALNLLTGVLVYTIFFSQIGIPDNHTVVISEVVPSSPAESAGIKPYDILVAANGIHITSYAGLTEVVQSHLDKPLTLTMLRDGKSVEITLVPRSEYPSDQGPMGVGIATPLIPAKSWFQTVPVAISSTAQDINSLLSLPARLIAGTVPPQAAQIGGPRSVWNLFQQAVSRDVTSRQDPQGSGGETQPTNYTLLIIISLTVTVAVANLLPIPGLDGGRIFLTLIEIISRRSIPAKYQAVINGVGFIFLMTLLGFFYIKDFINPVTFTLP